MTSCPVCFSSPVRRPFVLPCYHIFCDQCAARFLWDKAQCAVCRAPVMYATPAWDERCDGPPRHAASLMLVKHRGVTFEIDLDQSSHECPYQRLSTMFSIPADRLKLIQRGKLLPARGSPELRDAILLRAPIHLMGSRHEQQVGASPSIVRRLILRLQTVKQFVASLIPIETSPSSLVMAILRVFSVVLSTGGRFVQSLVTPGRWEPT